MIKKILVFMANSTLSLSLLLAVSAGVILATFNPGNFKQWLEEGQVYDNIVGAMLEEAGNAVDENPEEGKTNPLKDPGVRDAAQKALSPAFLRSNTEEVIDSVAAWLNGDIDRPDFAIELGEVKESFATNVGNYARERYASLPECTPTQVLSEETDILQVPCRVPGYDAEAAIQKAVDELKNNEDFLGDETITFDDIVKDNDQNESGQTANNWEKAPGIYQGARIVPFIFGTLAVLSAVVVVFASESKRRGVRTIASTLIPVGLVLFLEAWLVSIGVSRLSDAVNNSSDAGQDLKNIAGNTLHSLGNDLWRSIMIFAAVITLCGLAIVAGLILTRSKDGESPGADDKTAEHESDKGHADKPAVDHESKQEPEEEPKEPEGRDKVTHQKDKSKNS